MQAHHAWSAHTTTFWGPTPAIDGCRALSRFPDDAVASRLGGRGHYAAGLHSVACLRVGRVRTSAVLHFRPKVTHM